MVRTIAWTVPYDNRHVQQRSGARLDRFYAHAEIASFIQIILKELGTGKQAQSDAQLKPIAFLSQKLSPTESRYTSRDMELLALIHYLREWRHELLGTGVTVYSDHRSVINFLTRRAMPSTVKYVRWLDLLAEFDLDIHYVRGKANVVADALSRRRHLLPPEEKEVEEECFAMSTSTTSTNLQESMLTAASGDAYYQQLLQSPLDPSDFVLEDALLYKVIHQSPLVRRLFVPKSMRSVVMHEAHDAITAGHLGVARTKATLSSRFWWPSLQDDVKTYVQIVSPVRRISLVTMLLMVPCSPWRILANLGSTCILTSLALSPPPPMDILIA